MSKFKANAKKEQEIAWTVMKEEFFFSLIVSSFSLIPRKWERVENKI